MVKRIKSAFVFLLQPKAVLFGISVFLFAYIFVTELRFESTWGCYNCGFNTRQAFLILIASFFLLIKRNWTVSIALLASLKVIYSIGFIIFWNKTIRSYPTNHLTNWAILYDSITWSYYELEVIWFVELSIALIIFIYALLFLQQRFREKFLFRQTNLTN